MSYSDFKSECTSEIQKQGENLELKELSTSWFNLADSHKYPYHFEWLGRPIIQYPQDIVQLQELIFKCKPDLIIETGIAHGGSVILSASMLCLLDVIDGINPRNSSRSVIGIDIDIRDHNRLALDAHPLRFKLDLIEGSSIDPHIVNQVHTKSDNFSKVMVFLDSNHTHSHVFAELNAYANLVSKDSYCVVFDTAIANLPPNSFPDRPWDLNNNPQTAVHEWLRNNSNFQIDNFIDDKLLISEAPHGYLKRI